MIPPEAYIDAMAVMLDLPVDPAHREGVVRNFLVAQQAAEAMAALVLDERADPAALFHPGGAQ